MICALLLVFVLSWWDFLSRREQEEQNMALLIERNGHMTDRSRNWKAVTDYRNIEIFIEAGQDLCIAFGCIATAALESQRGGIDITRVIRFLGFAALSRHVLETTKELLSRAEEIQQAQREARKVVALIQKEPSIRSSDRSPNFYCKGGAVRFEDVSFSYDNTTSVVKNFSLCVSLGQSVAIVGKSGSGTTTLFKMLNRLCNPNHGRIVVDEQTVSQVELTSYRQHLAVVPQIPTMFDMSVQDNVRYARLSASLDEVKGACKLAEIHDMIMQLPQQYDSHVGELAQRLSGGEVQRISIARLFLQDPDIVFLDEPTSHLDAITERKIWRAFRQFLHGRTTFTVLHRLSALPDADKVIVMQDGRIVEQGHHDALAARRDGIYCQMLKEASLDE